MSAAEASYLLDTSALLTLLEDEPGAERVEHVLRRAHTLISAVSLLEVRSITLQARTEAEADVRHALLKRSGASVVWDLDEPTFLKAAALKAARSISLADALISATAQRYEAVLMHKDPELEALPASIKQERLPYKAAGKAR